MSWNGSENKSAAPAPKKTVKAPPSKWRGIIALVVVAVGGIAAWFFLHPSAAVKQEESSVGKRSAITEVAPAVVPKQEEAKPEPVQLATNRFGRVAPKKKPETYKDERGVLRYKVGNGRVPLPDAHKYLIKSRPYEDNMPQFKHPVETEIAAVLLYKPGDAALGDFPHDKAFKQDFINALMEPVEILETDSEEDKRLKQDVEQTKHELAQRLKNGEDVGEILQEARDEMRRMAVYKNEIIEMTREQVLNNAETTADVDAYYEAMNKMLESKGIEPVKMSGLMRRKIGYDLMKQQEEAAKKTKNNIE